MRLAKVLGVSYDLVGRSKEAKAFPMWKINQAVNKFVKCVLYVKTAKCQA